MKKMKIQKIILKLGKIDRKSEGKYQKYLFFPFFFHFFCGPSEENRSWRSHSTSVNDLGLCSRQVILRKGIWCLGGQKSILYHYAYVHDQRCKGAAMVKEERKYAKYVLI